MKSITEIKTLGDLRTIISTHTRSVPRHKGSSYLEILSLGMERLRLQTESAWLAKRQGRIGRRLAEIHQNVEALLDEVRHHGAPEASAAGGASTSEEQEQREPVAGAWRSMTVEY